MPFKIQKFLIVAALLGWCVVLVFARAGWTGEGFFSLSRLDGAKSPLGLLWNLFLAIVPLLAASGFDLSRRKSLMLPAAWFLIWLLFFPNAPYICTDLIHLRVNSGAPLWYDLALLLSFAGTGLFFGYASLLDVHRKIENRFGKTIGWSVALASLVLCALGIYIGRFLRWNSWDVFTRPLAVVKHLFVISTQPSEHPNPFSVTLIFATALILGYCALRVVASESRE